MLIYSSVKPGVDYIKDSMGLEVHYDPSPRPKLLGSQAPTDFLSLKKHLALNAHRAIELTGGIPAKQNLIPPGGFEVKGNSKSREYLGPTDKGYDYMVNDLWFVNLAAAKSALHNRGANLKLLLETDGA
jgi:hypothetical protein